jgi:hypothetical protein
MIKTSLKFAALFLVLFAANPRAGFHHSGQFYVASCNFQAGASVGPNGIGYAYLDHSNAFSGLAMKAFGC